MNQNWSCVILGFFEEKLLVGKGLKPPYFYPKNECFFQYTPTSSHFLRFCPKKSGFLWIIMPKKSFFHDYYVFLKSVNSKLIFLQKGLFWQKKDLPGSLYKGIFLKKRVALWNSSRKTLFLTIFRFHFASVTTKNPLKQRWDWCGAILSKNTKIDDWAS